MGREEVGETGSDLLLFAYNEDKGSRINDFSGQFEHSKTTGRAFSFFWSKE